MSGFAASRTESCRWPIGKDQLRKSSERGQHQRPCRRPPHHAPPRRPFLRSGRNQGCAKRGFLKRFLVHRSRCANLTTVLVTFSVRDRPSSGSLSH